MRYSRRKNTSNSLALSSIELLVCFTLSFPLTLILLKQLHNFVALKTKAEQHYKNAQIQQTVLAYSQKIMRDFDSHPLPLYPIVHKNGVIKFKNLQKHRVMTGKQTKRPMPNSDAVSIYRLETLDSLQVNNYNSSNIEACPRYRDFYISKYKKGFIGLSNSGFLETHGKLTRLPKLKKCIQIQAFSVDSISLRNRSSKLPYLRLLMPIVEHYTLYLDQTGNLRYLGHKGKKQTENQPILNGIKRLKIAPINIFDNRGFGLRVTIKTNQNFTVTFSVFSHTLHVNLDNFLFKTIK